MATPLKILTRGPCVQQAVLSSPRALAALSPKLSMAVSTSMRTAMSMTGGSPIGSLAGSPRCFPADGSSAFFVEASGSSPFSPCPSPKGSDQAKMDDLAKWCRDQSTDAPATATEAFPLAQNARKSFLARRAQRLSEAASESEPLAASTGVSSASSEAERPPTLLLGSVPARPRVSFANLPVPEGSLLGRRCFFEAPTAATATARSLAGGFGGEAALQQAETETVTTAASSECWMQDAAAAAAASAAAAARQRREAVFARRSGRCP